MPPKSPTTHPARAGELMNPALVEVEVDEVLCAVPVKVAPVWVFACAVVLAELEARETEGAPAYNCELTPVLHELVAGILG
jgi:hypothetical protein